MMLRMTFSLALLLAACTVETTDPTTGSSTGTAQPGASSEVPASEAPGAGGGPVFSVSCNGDVSTMPASVSATVAPKCVGGPPGTNCGGPPPATCTAQDVKLTYAPPALRCLGVDVYEWTGTACVAHNTHGEGGMLKCTGKDCEQLFKTKDACEAHLRECLSN